MKFTKGKWSKTTTFTTPTGWFITTNFSLKEGEKTVTKKVDFTELNELPDEIQEGIKSGELTIKLS